MPLLDQIYPYLLCNLKMGINETIFFLPKKLRKYVFPDPNFPLKNILLLSFVSNTFLNFSAGLDIGILKECIF